MRLFVSYLAALTNRHANIAKNPRSQHPAARNRTALPKFRAARAARRQSAGKGRNGSKEKHGDGEDEKIGTSGRTKQRQKEQGRQRVHADATRQAENGTTAGRGRYGGSPAKSDKSGSGGKVSGENLSLRFVGRTTNYAYLCIDNYEPHPSMIFRSGNTAAACQRKRHHRLQGAPSLGIRQNPMVSASHYPG